MNVDQNSNTKCNEENRHRADAYIFRPSSYKSKVIHWTEWRWLVHEKHNEKASLPFIVTFRTFYINAGQLEAFAIRTAKMHVTPIYIGLDSPLIILINGINSLTECSDRKVRYSYWICAHHFDWKSVKSLLAMFVAVWCTLISPVL